MELAPETLPHIYIGDLRRALRDALRESFLMEPITHCSESCGR